MIFDMRTADYVLRVTRAVFAGTIAPDELTNVCPECSQTLTWHNTDGHAVVDVSERVPEPRVAVIIACEGYWCVDPERVGLPRGQWMAVVAPMMGESSYPKCAGCMQSLCWLDRQWDECPACELPIPPELRVDNDFKPYPVCMCGSVHVPDEQVNHVVVTGDNNGQ